MPENGDGAVIASDSVVVKNAPPYAIVGGNPAKRTPDKLHDNFRYFNDVDKFISLHDT